METWLMWEVVSHTTFLLLLLTCYLLISCGLWPNLHHRRIHLSKDARRKVRGLVEEGWRELLPLIKEVLDCQLSDGKFIRPV